MAWTPRTPEIAVTPRRKIADTPVDARRPAPGGAARGDGSQVWLPVGLLLAVACAATIAPVYERIGGPLLLAMCTLAFSNPFSGLALVSASQLVPDPDWTNGISISSLVFLGWAATTLVRVAFGHRARLPIRAIGLLLPVTGWATIASLTHGDPYVPTLLARDALYIVLAYDLYLRAGCDVRRCTLALLGGCCIAAFGYWAYRCGLDLVVGNVVSNATLADMSRGWARIEFGRTDSNTVAVNISAILASVVAVVVAGGRADGRRGSRGSNILWLAIAGVVGVMMLPALAGTMSRGGLAELGAGLAVVCLFVVAGPRTAGKAHRARVAKLIGMGLVVATILAVTPYGPEIVARIIETQNFTTRQGGLIAARGLTLDGALASMAGSPVLGSSYQQFVDTYGLMTHSSFFDVGVGAGLPGLVLFIGCASWPIILAVRSKARNQIYLPVFVAYVCFVVYASTISALSNKTFWCFWLLCLMNVGNRPPAPKRVRRPAFAVRHPCVTLARTHVA